MGMATLWLFTDIAGLCCTLSAVIAHSAAVANNEFFKNGTYTISSIARIIEYRKGWLIVWMTVS